nr:PaaI family thioesterase [Corynebacterium lactis]
MNQETGRENSTNNASGTSDATSREKGLREYLMLIRKAVDAPLSAEEIGALNSAIVGYQLGGYDVLLGTRFVEVGPRKIVAELAIDATHLQPWGLANGGVYCSLGETAASVAGYIAAGAGPAVVGVNNNTDFYRSARAGDTVVSVATPVHLGRTMQVWQVEHSRKSDGKALARTNLRVAVLSES